MKDNPTIKLENISIKFILDKVKKKSFFALKNISLQLEEGKILGLIGKNGAGKSTLLKIMAGIYYPTEGKVNVRGRIAPLIELGSSFIPNLSGYDNIFFTGGLFGFSKKEIMEKVDKIIEFSGLDKFKNLPVKNYSTGMFARLSFSTMLFFDPDIVLIDEVFAVGDEDFQKKSMNKIFEFKEKGKTIVIASHNLSLIESFCDKVIVLDEGQKVFDGDSVKASSHYLDLFNREEKPIDQTGKRWGTREIEITGFKILDENGQSKRIFDKNDYLELKVEYRVKTQKDFVFGIAIKTKNGFLVAGPNKKIEIDKITSGKNSIGFIMPKMILNEGEYSIDMAFYDDDYVTAFDHITDVLTFIVRKSSLSNLGFIHLPCEWNLYD
ncbi:MAG: ABC transporter ATP-binding protein [Candidatus Aminicenantes bacterium]|nr:ABC transporter ATP-binding protein [Candidatus Aminicenantes bacterium]